MREVIFRGQTDSGEWVYGSLVQKKYKRAPCIYKETEGTRGVIYEKVKSETVGQLVCRVPNKSMYVDNSFNLFEGDLFKEDKSDTIYQVKWDGFGFYGVSNEGDEYGAFTCDLRRAIKAESFELVGNIHENSELIKK